MTGGHMATGDVPSDQVPTSRVIVAGGVLCGGRSTRFGSDKALAPVGSSTVGARVVDALRGGGVDPIAAIGGTAGQELHIPTIPDLRPGDGPLGGLATSLLWFKAGLVLVVPCDLPLLSADHVALLVSAAAPGQAVVATVGGEPQISLAIWPAEAGRDVLGLLDRGVRKFRAALDVVDWVGAEVPTEAVTDADTPEELQRLLAGRTD